MLPAELEQYLHEHIPLSKAMAVFVVSVAQDAVVLGAPLAPNINHRETVSAEAPRRSRSSRPGRCCTRACAPRGSRAAS